MVLMELWLFVVLVDISLLLNKEIIKDGLDSWKDSRRRKDVS